MDPRPPVPLTASGLIRHRAATTPHSVAYTFEGVDTSFDELDAIVDRWAKALLAAGVRRGECVSILTGNHPAFLHLAFAAARIGAFLAPLNTWHHAPELAYTLDHSEARVLVAVDRLRRQDYRTALAEIRPARTGLHTVVALEEGITGSVPLAEFLSAGDRISDDELTGREALNTPEDLMYILYTSGSTSTPKAVQLHQGHLIENAWWIAERQGITEDDRAWLATPLFYGVSAMQGLFGALSHGARVVLQEAFNPEEALALLESQRCTVYYGFGNLTRKLLATPGFDRERLSLRKGMIGFSLEDRKLALDELGVAHGVSVYGMTETYGLFALTQHDDPREIVLETQGYPLPGNELRIADPITDQEVEPGEIGELQLRGRVTSGYFKDAARTAEAFTEDGYFKTGDLARIREDGRLVFHSRTSETMKPGGVNVAPQEVEALLDQIPGISQAHVCSIADPQEGEVVVAFVETETDGLSPEAICSHLRSRAASYKIPRHFLFRTDASLPKLPSGKISRPLLRAEAERELQGGRR